MNSKRFAGLALAVAGLLSIAAAVERWWPACHPGRLETSGCEAFQDHRFDYLAPTDPWTPIGHAAELQGVSYLALAAALALIGFSLRRTRVRAVLLFAVAASIGLAGALTLQAGVTGEPVSLSTVQSLALIPILPLVLGEFVLGTLIAPSYDTPPWTGAFSGLFLMIAGLVTAFGVPRWRRTPSVVDVDRSEVRVTGG